MWRSLRHLNVSRLNSMNNDQYERWLIGFIDGEGNFLGVWDRIYLRLMFRIRLHVDVCCTILRLI